MTVDHKEREPRSEKDTPALRFEKKADIKESGASGKGRRTGAWKKSAAHMITTSRSPQDSASDAPNEPKQAPTPQNVEPTHREPRSEDVSPEHAIAGTMGQSVPKYREQKSKRSFAAAEVNEKFRQQSKQAPPADRLRHNTSADHSRKDPQPGQAEGSDGTGAIPEPAKLRKARERMERLDSKLDAARNNFSAKKTAKPPGPVKRAAGFAAQSAHGFVHGKVYEVEHENVGTESAHRSELVSEAAGRKAIHFTKQRIRSHPARAVRNTEVKAGKARAKYHFRQTVLEHPEMENKNILVRTWRKHRQREYAQEGLSRSGKLAGNAVSVTKKIRKATTDFVKQHPKGLLFAFACILLLMLMQSCTSSMMTLSSGVIGALGGSTYPSEDADLLGAEAAYCSLEAELQDYLDNYTRTHSYDEYHFNLDGIKHDPYVLLSILCAFHEGSWTISDIQNTLQILFDRQYTLTESVSRQTRYYTDTHIDEDGNEYEVSVPYSYYICTVTLENFNLSHLPVYIMGENQLSRYAMYMGTLGNRPDLFPDSSYVPKYTSPPTIYDVPAEYKDDPIFAAILTEAEKYIGYPYVWGGSAPSTSFDCSGFVSYVYNQCGWDFGRLGAQGLCNISTRTTSPRPGDLVFFVGTYDTPGVSHVGIYVGDGMMLHCGDPIQYANLNSGYWQEHLYAYGRLT